MLRQTAAIVAHGTQRHLHPRYMQTWRPSVSSVTLTNSGICMDNSTYNFLVRVMSKLDYIIFASISSMHYLGRSHTDTITISINLHTTSTQCLTEQCQPYVRLVLRHYVIKRRGSKSSVIQRSYSCLSFDQWNQCVFLYSLDW